MHKDGEHIVFALFFACMVGKVPKTPKLSPIADDAITQGDIVGLGSLVNICEYYLLKGSFDDEIIKISRYLSTNFHSFG